jgi:chromosome segregation ATPase
MEPNAGFSKLSERVAILENQSVQLGAILSKLETTIDRLTEVSTSLKEFVVVHDHRLGQIESHGREVTNALERRRRETDDQIEEIQHTVQSMDVTLQRHMRAEEEMMKGTNNSLNRIENNQSDVRERVELLERWRWQMAGGLAVLTAIFSLIANAFFK